jgi:hypothetical protein
MARKRSQAVPLDTDKTFFGSDRRLPRHPKGQMLVDQIRATPSLVMRRHHHAPVLRSLIDDQSGETCIHFVHTP